MKLPKICIERPVFAFVLNVVLVVIGLMAYKELATNYFPNLPNTQAQVDIIYPGASADLMESQVTKVVENLVSSLDDVESYSSSSWYQHSRTVINFKLTNNLEQDFAKLRDKMANITTQLPDDVDPPSISTERNADLALLISFTSNKADDYKIRIINGLGDFLPEFKSLMMIIFSLLMILNLQKPVNHH